MSDTPNILWICTDQQRFDTLGCYGNPYVHTPNLDRLAEQSTLFEYAFSQSPVCTPSRSSFLTGRYPRTTRCRQNGQSIPSDEIPVTKMLHDAGYVCGLSGKLHISACNPSACHGTERRIDDGYDQFFWSHAPGLRNDGSRSSALVELVDLAPTILEWVGLDSHPAMQGHTLHPLLKGDAPLNQHRDDIYCEYYNAMPGHKNPPAHATMVRTDRHKLVAAHGTGGGELYDLETDPTETHNQWNNPNYTTVRLDLMTRLADRMAWTVDPLPPREAGF